MKALLTINNADNQLVAYLNNRVVYNKSHENNPSLNDVVDLSDKLVPGTNSISILGVNWSGPATYKGNVSLDATITPWEYAAKSTSVGVVWKKEFVFTNPASGVGVTITFAALFGQPNVNSYTESGYNLSGKNTANPSIAAFGCNFFNGVYFVITSYESNVFTFRRADGAGFDMISMMLMNINDKVGSQTIDFTGTLIAGGTVTHRITTAADLNQFSTFSFPPSLTKLASLTWGPSVTLMANVNVVASGAR